MCHQNQTRLHIKTQVIFGSFRREEMQMGSCWSSCLGVSLRPGQGGQSTSDGGSKCATGSSPSLLGFQPTAPHWACAQVTLEGPSESKPALWNRKLHPGGRAGRKEGGLWGEGTVQKGRGITDEAKLILETIKSLKREHVFSRDSESLWFAETGTKQLAIWILWLPAPQRKLQASGRLVITQPRPSTPGSTDNCASSRWESRVWGQRATWQETEKGAGKATTAAGSQYYFLLPVSVPQNPWLSEQFTHLISICKSPTISQFLF